jgi:membrane protease YdiL (CAAX protease family)
MKFSARNWPEYRIWLSIILAEASFVVFSRVVVGRLEIYTVEAELIRSAGRVLMIAFYWLLFRQLLASRPLVPSQIRHALFLVPITAFLCVPLLVGYMAHVNGTTKALFAATSIIVGFREEIAFRAVIQTLLARRVGDAAAIGVTTMIFTAWHIGVIPWDFFAYGQVVAASVLLGIIYARTGNLILVSVIHALYDALWSLTPILDRPIIPFHYGLVLLALATIGIVLWSRTSMRAGEGQKKPGTGM